MKDIRLTESDVEIIQGAVELLELLVNEELIEVLQSTIDEYVYSSINLHTLVPYCTSVELTELLIKIRKVNYGPKE